MTGPATYLDLLRMPSVGRALAGALIGRLPTAMTALAITLLLRAHGVDFHLNIVAVAYAERHTVPGGAGTLLALSATGAVLGAVVYGRRPPAAPPAAQATWFAGGLAVAYLLVATMAPPWIMAGICLATGVFLSPLLVVSFTMIDTLAPPGTVTEAFAWMITLLTTGSAAGSALAGVVLDARGPAAAAIAIALAALLGTGVLALLRAAR